MTRDDAANHRHSREHGRLRFPGTRQPLQVHQPACARLRLALEEQSLGFRQHQLGLAGQPGVGQGINPASHYPELATEHLGMQIACDDLRRRLAVVARQGVSERLLRQVVRQVPAGRPGVQVKDVLKPVSLPERSPEKIGEEPVVAEPGTLIIKRDEKEVRVLQ